ncbi:hypothetical protein [Ferrovibrio sp.]|jgi:hypothetical protein|uniref:hypothetical protein n=1 Tax=Ferrovibrio sp. TaxID=1917215 RepID=UPI000CAD4A19|nr:hypothetical protein [Ferrovibrio sp.]PJI41835.1 MAG: hypothetical protein CTR53_05070 [Ferrovibrio sp.]
MSSLSFRSALLGATIGLAAQAAWAAEPTAAVLDPNASTAPLPYQSAFSGYQRPQFEGKADWRKANDTVRDVGGHMGAIKSDSAEMPTKAGDAVPAAGGHAGHGK